MRVFDVQAEFQGGFKTPRTSTRFLVVHHAADHYPQATGIEDVRAIRNWHVNHNGWSGIGYQIVLAEETNGGAVARYNVSDLNTQRAHVAKRNHEACGACLATDLTNVPIPPDKWLDAAAETFADLKRRYPDAQIVGHGDIALPGHETTCPGRFWSTWRPMLLARVDALLAPADDFAEWGSVDQPEGVARGFAIPQTWLKNKKTLGRCLRGERYDLPGLVSRALFQGGEVRYLAWLGVTEVLPYPRTLP